METPNPKPVKIGVRYGLILLACGLVIVGINVVVLFASDYYFPKLLTVGIAISLLAPIFMVFPGGTLDKMPEMKDMGKALMQNAPTLHKAMWIIWGIASVAIAFFALISFDPDFLK
jgi:hypothetical protein